MRGDAQQEIELDGVLAAAYLPTDGHIDPTSLTNALARGAVDRGATILRHTRVTQLVRERGGWTVSTSRDLFKI